MFFGSKARYLRKVRSMFVAAVRNYKLLNSDLLKQWNKFQCGPDVQKNLVGFAKLLTPFYQLTLE